MTSLIDDIKRDREAGTPFVAQVNVVRSVEQRKADNRRRGRISAMEAQILRDAEIKAAAEDLAKALERQEQALSDWADTFPYDDEEGEAVSAKAEGHLRTAENRTRAFLRAYRKATGESQ